MLGWSVPCGHFALSFFAPLLQQATIIVAPTLHYTLKTETVENV